MPDLTLNLKKEYFDQIKAGTKTEEYRLVKPYWAKRLEDRRYDNLIICRGYPSKDDTKNRIIAPYEGYTIKTITHPHFGPKSVKVYVIKINLKEHEMPEESEEKIYFTKEAAKFLGIPLGSLYHYIKQGRLNKGPWGRHAFTESQLIEFKKTIRPTGGQFAEPKEGCYTATQAKEMMGGISRQRLYLLASRYGLKVGRGLFDKGKVDRLIAEKKLSGVYSPKEDE